jgi:hypothetical protein
MSDYKMEASQALRELFTQINDAKLLSRKIMRNLPSKDRADCEWVNELHDALFSRSGMWATIERLEAEAKAEVAEAA